MQTAEHEFLRCGLKKTSMEGIARAAEVAKATAYAYFKNKYQIFDVVCAAHAHALALRARSAAARATTPPAAVIASLATKFCAIYTILHASPHAHELLTASLASANAKTTQAHGEYVAQLAMLLSRTAGVDRRGAGDLAEILDRAAEGLVAKAASEAEVLSHITVLLERVLRS